ncbi:MAG: hypothetical protein NTZ35_02000 [Ignavibacteriales bacterium]|nr:hypothetical protein [Ignavibacteriales bacterium]
MENLGIDRIALELTTALVKSYGKELTGSPEAAIKLVVSDYFKIYDEVTAKLKARTESMR